MKAINIFLRELEFNMEGIASGKTIPQDRLRAFKDALPIYTSYFCECLFPNEKLADHGDVVSPKAAYDKLKEFEKRKGITPIHYHSHQELGEKMNFLYNLYKLQCSAYIIEQEKNANQEQSLC